MSSSFYPKMAVSNIKKNRKMYIPYMITSIITIMMFFMMNTIINNSAIMKMHGGGELLILLNISVWVAGIFSVVFLFYTNSFLIKRRTKEIGLYNILGMEKRHIAKMMMFESIIMAVVTITIGILLGIVFGKLMFLLLFKLINYDVVPKYELPGIAVVETVIFFVCIYVVTFMYNLVKVGFTKPIEMLHGGEIGEKEPKTKIIMTIIGVLSLGSGYYFALTVDSVMKAISYFLIAVVLVIIGTYLLFTTGSIAIIKLLRKNKKFYYKTGHFTSVSGMLYRMKQNAVGLANICILSTMVLITIATTVCLYSGIDDAVNSGYPSEMNIYSNIVDISEEQNIKNKIDEIANKYNTVVRYDKIYENASVFGKMNSDGTFELMDVGANGALSDKNIRELKVITIDSYNRVTGCNETLNDGEVIVCSKEKIPENGKINIVGGTQDFSYTIKSVKKDSKFQSDLSYVIKNYIVVVKDIKDVEKIGSFQISKWMKETFGDVDTFVDYDLFLSTDLSKEDSIKMSKEISQIEEDGYVINCENKYQMIDEFGEMYGGFLFIGIFVGSLFLMATVLIIYYKQISEGYEDKARFEIMQKVGMSREEVKKTIRSQVLMVFFIPLAVAALHVAVSYRIVEKMMQILSLGNTSLFIGCTIGTVLVFSVIYALVFIITTRSYYNIVSEAE